MVKNFARLALLGAATLTACYATSITDGQTLPAMTIAAPAGTLLTSITNQTLSFANTGNPLSASFSEWVYKDSTTGDLDFVYQFTNTTPTPVTSPYTGVITDVTMASFNAFTTNVGYESGTCTPTSTVPDSVKRSMGVIDFAFGTASTDGPGVVTPLLVIDTNATTYSVGTVGVVGGVGGSAVANGPLIPVVAPEPVTLGMMGAGLLAFGLFRWRKSRA